MRGAFAVVAFVLLACAACADTPKHDPQTVSPVFGDPCRNDRCHGQGMCVAARGGGPACMCNPGYTGASCDLCESGFHRDARDRCVTDTTCEEQTQNPCAPYGSCVDQAGVIACECDPGYEGPRCNLCAPGYARDEHGECLQLVIGGGGGVLREDGGTLVDGSDVLPVETCDQLSCGGHGACDDEHGVVRCTCEAGYTSARCESCAAGFHRDTLGACVADEVCATNECGAHGDCVDSSGEIECVCHGGYAGAACASCATGFHLEGSACVLDESCLLTSCPSHATCDDSDGSVKCACDPGYQGAACGACMTGYYLDYLTHTCSVFDCKQNPITAPGTLDFENLAGYPTSVNTCSQSTVHVVGPATFTSIDGDGTVWLCAQSAWSKVPTKHVMLEAGKKGPARIVFTGPITKLSFDYGAYSALALQVLADGVLAGSFSSSSMMSGAQTFTFSAPVSVIELLSAGGSTNLIAIDNLAYEPPVCP